MTSASQPHGHQPPRRRADRAATPGQPCPARPARSRSRRTDVAAGPATRSRCCPTSCTSPAWLDLDRQRALADDFRRWAAAAGRAAPPARAGRAPDDRAVGVPRLALAAVRVQPHGRRHRRRAGQAVAGRRRRARPSSRRRHVRSRRRRARTSPTRRSSTCTPPAPGSGCTRTARSRPTRPSSRSASATRACSASPASIAARARSSTSSCAAATCSSSAAPTAASTTASRRCSTAPGRGDRPAARAAEHHGAGDRAVTWVGIMAPWRPFDDLVQRARRRGDAGVPGPAVAGRRRRRVVGDVPVGAAGLPAPASGQRRAGVAGDHRPPQGARPVAGRRRAGRSPAGELPDVATTDPAGPDDELRAALGRTVAGRSAKPSCCTTSAACPTTRSRQRWHHARPRPAGVPPTASPPCGPG